MQTSGTSMHTAEEKRARAHTRARATHTHNNNVFDETIIIIKEPVTTRQTDHKLTQKT
jgi:hypothetical protein